MGFVILLSLVIFCNVKIMGRLRRLIEIKQWKRRLLLNGRCLRLFWLKNNFICEKKQYHFEVEWMVFKRFIKNGKKLKSDPEEVCADCGVVIGEGDVYYTHMFHHGSCEDHMSHYPYRKPEHICEACFDKKFI